MGQMFSSYFHSSEVVNAESDFVRHSQTEVVEHNAPCDMDTSAKESVTSDKQYCLMNVDSVAVTTVDTVRSAVSIPSSTSMAGVTSSPAKAAEQPRFFAHMTEEHWERLNIMCIVSPSSA